MYGSQELHIPDHSDSCPDGDLETRDSGMKLLPVGDLPIVYCESVVCVLLGRSKFRGHERGS